MINWDEIESINDYKNDWAETDKGLITNLADDLFFGVDKALGKFQTLDEERDAMLKADPTLNIKNLNDGYDLEAERLNAINQKSSKGLQVIDINPGFLSPIDNALSLPYEFIFDGTNFMPNQQGSITANLRTVNIPIAGNFLKIEFIYENNASSNQTLPSQADPGVLVTPPATQIKYAAALFGGNELDLITGQTTASFDQFSRNKVWIDFGPSTGKPHIVPTSGRVFKTYFSEVNISLNIGSPKIRVTIGSNSEVYNDSNVSAINAKLALTGSGRMMADSDTVMSPFCLTENDVSVSTLLPNGYSLTMTNAVQYLTFALVQNYGYTFAGGVYGGLGYSVMWITRIRFQKSTQSVPSISYVRPYFFVGTLGSLGTQDKRVHNFKLSETQNEYVFEPSEPIRVVIPNGSQFFVTIAYYADTITSTAITWSIDGYSYGELLRRNLVSGPPGIIVTPSKYITDATFLSDYNRILCLKDGP